MRRFIFLLCSKSPVVAATKSFIHGQRRGDVGTLKYVLARGKLQRGDASSITKNLGARSFERFKRGVQHKRCGNG